MCIMLKKQKVVEQARCFIKRKVVQKLKGNVLKDSNQRITRDLILN